jgi:hypothetical protein
MKKLVAETSAADALTDEERDVVRQYRAGCYTALARRLLCRAHYDNVRAIAEDVLGAILRGEIDGPDGLEELLDEKEDSACAYTGANVRTLFASDNWEAGFGELGSEVLAGVEDCPTIFGRLAYYAMRLDIRERLKSLADEVDGLDLYDEETYPANLDDDEDEEHGEAGA